MKFSFRKLPPAYKLLLTGIIPLLALLYVSWQLYSEKENGVLLLSGYNSHVHEASELTALTDELKAEAEYSLAFALNKGRYSTLVIQRSRTDKWIHTLEESGDTAFTGFLKNTFQNGLVSARAAQDDGTAAIDGDSIMDFYNDAIGQLSTVNTIAPSNNAMLQSLNPAIESQRLLFKMESLLVTTRNKIYLSLLTPNDTPAIVSAADTAWHTLKNYEAAFLRKAPASQIKMYNDKENATALQPVFEYLDYAVTHHQFVSTFTAGQWWASASGGIKILHKQYLVSQQRLQTELNHIYQSQIKARNLTLLLVMAIALIVIVFFIFTIRAVNKRLKKQAASEKGSPGKEEIAAKEDIDTNDPPKDNISDLILDAIYRAGKTNGVTINGASNGVNGHRVPGINPIGNTANAVPGTNGQTATNKQEPVWKKNEIPHRPLELNKLQGSPASELNDDLANYALAKPDIVPGTNGAGNKEDAVKENIAAKAEQRTNNLTTQMNELIDAAAIESGRFNYHKHIFKLDELVSEMVSETGNAIPSYKISLRKNAALTVYGDRARIAQVLGNLLQNAIDHCPDADSIIVNLEEKGSNAVCSVEDFGDGIAKDQQEKIFEKFYRVNNINGVSHAGLGLGLHIAIEIIKQHHGKMWVISEPGLGSTFYFSLPVSTTSR